MIFVTVGTQGAFDRLVRAVDEWAGSQAKSDIFAQIGPSDYRPQHFEAARFLDSAEFRTRIAAAAIVVAHAGIGSIIAALEHGKPIIVMPRRADLREQRNDHQIATARRFAEQGRVIAAFDEAELRDKLDRAETLSLSSPIQTQASPQLIATIRAFLEGKPYNTDPVGSETGAKSKANRLG
jgi:UDP-N-acetylglucosamine transferase subunit ALG13